MCFGAETVKCSSRLRPPPALSASRIALLLDFDGTLIPYAGKDIIQPKVDATLPRLLGALHAATQGATAIVSGRGALELDRLLSPVRLPISGTHGAEIRPLPDAEVVTLFGSESLPEIIALCQQWAMAYPGIIVEHKPITAVLHFHGRPDLEAPAQAFARHLCGEFPAFIPQFGIGSVEMKPVGADKATGITRLMQLEAFCDRQPVFIGDDLADEVGFERVNQMGGIAIKVGKGQTVAGYHLADALQVRDWLASLLD
ncbi:trehalose-phosphatase [uncultured Cohaesibacter sp.]|uniref:trehalose-phosphatase n=1 Tax=uncultured Cohaesibacter sp. TaxID=1002546 RepID=UPI0029C89BAF|nr:trehalose-phosphatase [uncultured Cohaesibacter sp.]